jgi:hypothetical protein
VFLHDAGIVLGCPFIRHIFFIRIMNIFDLLFEYSNNIRIFILLYKLPTLEFSPKFQKNPKKKSKLGRNNRISELGLICTQKGQQIYKLDVSMFLVFFLEKLFLWFIKKKNYYSNIRSKNIRIMNNFPKKYSNKYSNNGHPILYNFFASQKI